MAVEALFQVPFLKNLTCSKHEDAGDLYIWNVCYITEVNLGVVLIRGVCAV